jgi:hypothetical protein
MMHIQVKLVQSMCPRMSIAVQITLLTTAILIERSRNVRTSRS